MAADSDWLRFEYVTPLGLSKSAAVQAEVEELWNEFLRDEAERRSVRNVIVAAVQPLSLKRGPAVISNPTVVFGYAQGPNKLWFKTVGFDKTTKEPDKSGPSTSRPPKS